MNLSTHQNETDAGLLLLDKPRGKTSFQMVATLRRLLGVRKIGHAGTLDPFATGVMVMLIGRSYTRLSDLLLCADKEYIAEIHLGISTDTFDCDGQILSQSSIEPSLAQIEATLAAFQGEVMQVPPMFSAKKQQGKKLYELARKGIEVQRAPVLVTLSTKLLSYEYPFVRIAVTCSKGTYIRAIAHDFGAMVGTGAHLSMLRRTRSGCFEIKDSFDGALLQSSSVDMIALREKIWNLSHLEAIYGDRLRLSRPTTGN